MNSEWIIEILKDSVRKTIIFIDDTEFVVPSLSILQSDEKWFAILFGLVGGVIGIFLNWFIGRAIYEVISREPWFAGKVKDNYIIWQRRYGKWFGWTLIFSSFAIGSYIAPLSGFFKVPLYILLILAFFSRILDYMLNGFIF
jgi:membrane protein YqaA with SNARE-associated domain